MSDHAADDTVPEVDESRRKFLIAATAGTGAVGAVLTAVPFVASWKPSERARAAGLPTEVDLSKIEPGQMATFIWRKKPIYVVQAHAGDAGIARRRMTASSRTPKSEDPISRRTPRTRRARCKPEVPGARSAPARIWAACRSRASTPGDARARRRLAGRLLLPLPRLEVRPGGARVRGFAGVGEPAHPAVLASKATAARHRRRCQPAKGVA